MDRETFLRLHGEWCALYEELCGLWRTAAPEIRKCVCEGQWARGNHTIGMPGGAEKLLEQVDEALSGHLASADAFNALLKFTTSALTNACRKGARPPVHHFFLLCDRYLRLAPLLPPAFEAWLLADTNAALIRAKSDRNVFSFEDLLTRLHGAVHDDAHFAAELAERFPAALIDEFQDTDPVQAAIFQRIYGGRNGWLYLIGDPKQAIYAFRGADLFTYLHAA